MMPSTINQPVRLQINNSISNKKLEDFRDRRRSFNQQYSEHDPKKIKHDTSLSKIEDKNKGVRKEEDEEQRYKTLIESLSPYDVVCGRGSLAFNNIGNRRFRLLISMNVSRYNKSDGRHRKGLFIGSLVRTFIGEIGARFFKMKNGQLVELTERQIRQKVGHALRDVLAFQESQNQQRQASMVNKISTKSPSTKPKPWIVGRTTGTSRSQEALSSVRSRLRKIRMERDSSAISPQYHVFPPPLPRNAYNNTHRDDTSNAALCSDRTLNMSRELTVTTTSSQKRDIYDEISKAFLRYTSHNEASTNPPMHSNSTVGESDNNHWHSDNRNEFENIDPIPIEERNNGSRNDSGIPFDDIEPIPMDGHREHDKNRVGMFH